MITSDTVYSWKCDQCNGSVRVYGDDPPPRYWIRLQKREDEDEHKEFCCFRENPFAGTVWT